MVVYIDVLIILNLYINYFLIRSSALITRRDISAKRCLLAALLGALGALVILLPELPFWAVAAEKAAIGAAITFAAFGKQKPVDFAVSALFFLIVSFAFAGVMTALWTFAAPFGMVFENGVAYFNIPISAVAAFTGAAYFILKLARYCADRRLRCDRICTVKISANGGEITLRGLCDTGNEMCDIFSGNPVIICRYEKTAEIIPRNVIDYFSGEMSEEGVRLVPCKTISSETLLPIFKAERIVIDGKTAQAVVGVTKNELGSGIDCVFNPKIISI